MDASKPTDHQQQIDQLKQTKQLISLLQKALENVSLAVKQAGTSAPRIDGVNVDIHQISTKLLNQLNGVAMPLLGVLQMTNRLNEVATPVVTSCRHSCMEEAAYALCKIWVILKSCYGFRIRGDCATRDSSTVGVATKTFVLPSLVSCAVALSSLEVADEDDGEHSFDSKDEKKSEDTVHNHSLLDRGDDCAMAVLKCMRSFFVNDDSDSAKPSPIAREVGNAMGGALVARLVQCCLSLLPRDAVATRSSRRVDSALQMEAAQTLHDLINGLPIKDLWQSILPGLFAGMYGTCLSKLRYSPSASSHKIASLCVETLACLLKQALGSDGREKADAENDTESIAASLFAAVNISAKTIEKPSAPQSKPDDVESEVNSRIPGPLSVLLSLMPGIRSKSVRLSGLHLCRIILVDTNFIWTEANKKSLGRKAFEYCLTLLRDDSGEIATCSREILRSFKESLGAMRWRRYLSQIIAPSILELVETLPLLAKSGKSAELRTSLNLVDGYTIASFRDMENDFDFEECLNEKRKSDISAALGCSESLEVIKNAFAVLFTPDIGSIVPKPMIEVDSSSDSTKLALRYEGNMLRFEYLDEKNASAATASVRLIARALGVKRCAFAIDGVYADMFEACVRSAGSRYPTEGSHRERLKWAGLGVVATELLAGVSGPFSSAIGPCTSKSTLKVLSSLASSVFPIIVSEPLWTLPSVSETRHNDPKEDNIGAGSRHGSYNASVVMVLMRFLCLYARVLGTDIKLLFPTILFPLIERASPIGNHSSVQRTAFSTLWTISETAGYSDISSLLAMNVDYLLDIISLRLRKYAWEGSHLERSLMGVVEVILQSVVYQRQVSGNQSSIQGVVFDAGAIVGNMLKCFLDHFDRQSNISNLNALDTVRVFRSINIFIASSVDRVIDCSGIDIHATGDDDEDFDWLNRLNVELNVDTSGYDESESLFEECNADPTDPPPTTLPDGDHPSDEGPAFTREINAINSILSRCGYLLCHAQLHLQVLCCQSMLTGFETLGKIGAFRRARQGESASNPLLPSIAEYWPAIIARLRAASASYVSSNRISRKELSIRNAMAEDLGENTQSRKYLGVLLASLFTIVAELCAGSDGFFEDRFRHDVYPIIAKLVGECLQPMRGRETNFILTPLLVLIKSVFESSCRYSLTGLVPAAGSLILPFLACVGNVGDEASAAVKAMLTVDSDALWRPLHKLACRPFPPIPINLDERTAATITSEGSTALLVSPTRDQTDIVLARRAQHLLDFIETTSESPLN